MAGSPRIVRPAWSRTATRSSPPGASTFTNKWWPLNRTRRVVRSPPAAPASMEAKPSRHRLLAAVQLQRGFRGQHGVALELAGKWKVRSSEDRSTRKSSTASCRPPSIGLTSGGRSSHGNRMGSRDRPSRAGGQGSGRTMPLYRASILYYRPLREKDFRRRRAGMHAYLNAPQRISDERRVELGPGDAFESGCTPRMPPARHCWSACATV